MKRKLPVALVLCVATGIAAAQEADVLGPHINAGHGCTACHTPHSRTTNKGHGIVCSANSGSAMLWGEDVHTVHSVGVPGLSQSAPDYSDYAGELLCLSCHDGNYAHQAMMKNRIYEAVPSTYGSVDSVPTMLDKPSITTGHDINDHPIGVGAQMGCGGESNWDCAENHGTIAMSGPRSARFAANYGFFVRPKTWGNTSIVVCTTCHNPHSMTVISVNANSASALFPAGAYATRYFLRAPYNPDTPGAGGNQAAQFCRQCHADKSNEMNAGPAGAMH